MKPKLIHQQAMDYSFKAKQALEEGNSNLARKLYQEAAGLESQVAEFYFDRPDLEPTRSIVVRSAAFLNLKAGLIEKAQKFIFFGLLHTTDELIKAQLNDALELTVSFKNMRPEDAYEEYEYINLLRQRSVHYVLEPSGLTFRRSVSLEMIKDFSDNYLKSLKAYATSALKRITVLEKENKDNIIREFEKLVNPLVTSSAYGSFKFSIANDFLHRDGEIKEVVELKGNVVINYHNEIFTNPLLDKDIKIIREIYSDEEVNEIFRPLIRIKSNSTAYKVGYYDSENFRKTFASGVLNEQKQKLLPIKQITQEDIGELENSIVHTRNSHNGRITKKTIYKERLKSGEFDIKTILIEPKDNSSLFLNEEIILSVYFNSEIGFRFSFDDFQIEHTDVEYIRGLQGFYTAFYKKIQHLNNIVEKNEQEINDWKIINKLIRDPTTIK